MDGDPILEYGPENNIGQQRAERHTTPFRVLEVAMKKITSKSVYYMLVI